MATTITAGNGTNGGAAVSSDNTGILELKTGTGAGTTAVTIGTDQSVTFASGTSINGITVGRGGGSVATNTAVGTSALASNTTGDTNTATGYQALTTNTSGVSNTAYGVQALRFNTTGGSNAAFGRGSLNANTTGANNVAVGREALTSNTTASNSTAVGYQALYSNTTGTNNTAVGYQTLDAVTTGNGNIAFGNSAGGNLTTGSSNTFIGEGSGSTTTGDSNTFLGRDSGYLVTSGTKNTIIGRYGGNQDGLDIRTASNYAIISDGDGNRLLSMYNGGTLALDGGATPQAGTGITFPATQSASSDANTLDDYEEGTWTPTDASGAGLTFTDVTATYTKIGRMVFAQFALRYPSTANGSNSLIGGMPFAPASGNSARQGFVSYTDETTLALILPEGGGATTAAPRTNAGAQITNAIMSLNYIWGEFVYFV